MLNLYPLSVTRQSTSFTRNPIAVCVSVITLGLALVVSAHVQCIGIAEVYPC